MKCEILTIRVVSRAATSGRSSNPVVTDRLVSIEDNGYTLSSINIDILDLDGIVLDTVGFHERDVVIINRESEKWSARDGNDTESVALSFLDIDDGERH
jgi:hypothetical protein